MTEDLRAGDTSDTETQSGETQAQPSASSPAAWSGDRDCNAGPERERQRCECCGPGQVTHIRRGQLSAFWEQSWFSGKANGVIGNKGL